MVYEKLRKIDSQISTIYLVHFTYLYPENLIMKNLSLLLLVTICLFSLNCNNNGGNNSKASSNSNTPKTTKQAQTKLLPALSNEILLKIYEECENIDVTYYDYPVSMSSNAENTKSFISIISQEPMYEDELMKKATGIMNYNIDGDIFIDAEFYLDLKTRKRAYFKFIKDKKYYYHPVKESGLNVLFQPINMALGKQ